MCIHYEIKGVYFPPFYRNIIVSFPKTLLVLIILKYSTIPYFNSCLDALVYVGLHEVWVNWDSDAMTRNKNKKAWNGSQIEWVNLSQIWSENMSQVGNDELNEIGNGDRCKNDNANDATHVGEMMLFHTSLWDIYDTHIYINVEKKLMV